MTSDAGRLLVMLRLAKPVRRRGFCPACGAGTTGANSGVGRLEMAAGGVAVAAVLAVAAVAWALTAWQMNRPAMSMGLGTFAAFATAWTSMMAAMMLPSAIPLVRRFAAEAEGRHARPFAVGALVAVYLAIWLAFGAVCYLAYNALGMPWRGQALVGGIALGLAALYALTPLKRLSQERCRELCALHAPLPFDLVRAGALAGWRYGLSCLGCSAGVMVAMVLVGMTSLAWTVTLAALVLVYKLAPPADRRLEVALAAAVAALGVAYVALA